MLEFFALLQTVLSFLVVLTLKLLVFVAIASMALAALFVFFRRLKNPSGSEFELREIGEPFLFFFSKLASVVFVTFGVVTLVFFILHWAGGDPTVYMLGEFAKPADIELLRESFGLNLPLEQQYFKYIRDVLNFDFGVSYHSKKAVITLITERLPATIELAIAGLFVALLIAIPLGMVAAVNKDTAADHGAMFFSLLGVSMPNFWLGPILILFFSLGLGWFPVSGREGFASLVLPAFTLGTALAAILSRMLRSSLLETLNEDYIRTAKAKGLHPFVIVAKHAMRNALLPVLTLLGLQLGALLGGAVITETVFSWPGVGKLTIDSILSRDYPVVQASILLISVIYVVVNLATDMIYALVDPRVRLGGRPKQ